MGRKAFRSHSDDLMITAFKCFSKVRMSQDAWGDKRYTNVKTTWKITKEKRAVQNVLWQNITWGLCMWRWKLKATGRSQKMLCSFMSVSTVAMWQEGAVQPAMTYTDLSPGAEIYRRAVHMFTHIHQRPHTRSLCQRLIRTESKGSIHWPHKLLSRLVCCCQSTGLLMRSRFIVFLCWKAMVLLSERLSRCLFLLH